MSGVVKIALICGEKRRKNEMKELPSRTPYGSLWYQKRKSARVNSTRRAKLRSLPKAVRPKHIKNTNNP